MKINDIDFIYNILCILLICMIILLVIKSKPFIDEYSQH